MFTGLEGHWTRESPKKSQCKSTDSTAMIQLKKFIGNTRQCDVTVESYLTITIHSSHHSVPFKNTSDIQIRW